MKVIRNRSKTTKKKLFKYIWDIKSRNNSKRKRQLRYI